MATLDDGADDRHQKGNVSSALEHGEQKRRHRPGILSERREADKCWRCASPMGEITKAEYERLFMLLRFGPELPTEGVSGSRAERAHKNATAAATCGTQIGAYRDMRPSPESAQLP